MTTAKQMYTEYSAAKGRIAANTSDFRDEMIVHLWERASKALVAHKAVKLELNTAQRQCAVYYRENDTRESRLAILAMRGECVPVEETSE
jgi:hypothetical protein